MVALGDRQVVDRAERTVAKLVEGEPGNILGRARHGERTTLDGEGEALTLGAIGEGGEGVLERVPRLGVERAVIDRLPRQPRQPVVAPASHFEHVELLLQEVDEGEEAFALQPVLVEVVRRPVRCGHHHDATLEELLEQPADDHRIGNIGDLKLVEAKQRGIAGNGLGDRRDRVAVDQLAVVEDTLVHLEHEGMEVHPPLLRDRCRREEQIHQHRFAATDGTEEIEPLRRRIGLDEAQPRAPAALPVPRLVVEQRARQALELLDGQRLARIGHQLARLDERAIGRLRAFGFSDMEEIDGLRWGHAAGSHSQKPAAVQNELRSTRAAAG